MTRGPSWKSDLLGFFAGTVSFKLRQPVSSCDPTRILCFFLEVRFDHVREDFGWRGFEVDALHGCSQALIAEDEEDWKEGR